jgi:dihydrofolate synthase/folylpolyglutamate synthase
VTWILDVAHNEQAARALAQNLRSFGCSGRLHAVLGILKGRDPKAIAEPLAEHVHAWYLGQCADPRSLPVSDLRTGMAGIGMSLDLHCCGSITEALQRAEGDARPGDCVLAFGSFTTVEAALRWRHSRPSS